MGLLLHICIDILYIVEVLKTLNHLVDCFTLLIGNFLEVVGDVGEFGRGDFQSVFFEVRLDLCEAFRITVDSDALLAGIFVFLFVEFVANSEVDEVKNHLVHVEVVLLLECELCEVVEEECK